MPSPGETGHEMTNVVGLLARAFWSTDSHTAFDAFRAMDSLCDLPGVGSRFVVAMADLAETEDQLAYLAAGPLEDLIHDGHPDDLAVLTSGVSSSARMREALSSVNPPDDGPGADWLARHG